MTELPFIDEHAVEVAASPEQVWDALARLLPRFGGPAGPAFARLLGCSEVQRPPSTPGLPAAIVGFRVAEADRPSLIELRGEHRFSHYALSFRIEPAAGSGSLLRARTNAEFPGAAGHAYRLAVIGTKAHVVAVRGLLASIKRGAERAYPAGQAAGSSLPRSA